MYIGELFWEDSWFIPRFGLVAELIYMSDAFFCNASGCVIIEDPAESASKPILDDPISFELTELTPWKDSTALGSPPLCDLLANRKLVL